MVVREGKRYYASAFVKDSGHLEVSFGKLSSEVSKQLKVLFGNLCI